MRSLDQFYQYIEQREKGVAAGAAQRGNSVEKGVGSRASGVAQKVRKYVLRNGITIPVEEAEEPSPRSSAVSAASLPLPPPPPVPQSPVLPPAVAADFAPPVAIDADPEPTEEDVAARDAEDAARWRSLSHAVQILATLSRENSEGEADPHHERRQLVERLLNPMLTLEDTARLLGVCPVTVRRWANKGVLPYQRTVGQQRRFYLADVLACREQREPETTERASHRSGT